MIRKWLWMGGGIACIAFLEYVVFADAGVSDAMLWIVYGSVGLGAIRKAFPQSAVKGRAERQVRIGYSHQDAGDYAASERCFQEAMSILKELEVAEEQRVGEALQHSNLGLLYHQWGRTQEAESSLRSAISIYAELQRDDDSAPLYASLAKVYLDTERLEEAELAAEHAREIYRARRRAEEQLSVLSGLLEEISRRRTRG